MVQWYSPAGAHVPSHEDTLVPLHEHDWNYAPFGPPESTSQMANESVQPFLHSSWQSVIRHAHSPNNCPFTWGYGPHLIHAFLGPTRVQNPYDISIGSAVFKQLTAECYYTLQQAAPSPIIITPFPWGICTTKMTSWSVQLFLHRWPQSVPILYSRMPLPPQNCPLPWGMWTLSNTWFLGPNRVLIPNGIVTSLQGVLIDSVFHYGMPNSVL